MNEFPQDDLAALLFARAAPDAARLAVASMAEAVERTLHLARSLADSGRHLELEGLDDLVGQLTARTLDLEPTQGRLVRPRLVAVLTQLNLLEAKLRQSEETPAPP